MEENQEPPEGWPRNPIFNAPGDVPGPPVQFGPPVEPTTVQAGEGFTGIGLPENDIFYFHPDHLGSTSYITTRNGSISQHVEYIAFGEVLFEEHSSSFSSPYLFNGKELDRETNLSYYGARYLDMKTSLWLNVDPLAEKFFNQSPYNYCFNNPVVMLDPDGKGPINPFRLGKPSHPKFTYDDGFLGKTPTYTPQVRKPEFGDYASYSWWGIKTGVATVVRWDLGNALSAYRHFRGASAKNFTFDLPDYYDDDDSGKKLLTNATNIAKKSAQELLKKSGNIKMTSEGFAVGGGDARFPYPDTEDWQKAIGAFNFWMSADVSATEKKGVITYTMKLTIHAEDKYNFNPGMQDIATGTPDDANGTFELTGLGKQFMQNGTSTHTIKWSVKTQTTP